MKYKITKTINDILNLLSQTDRLLLEQNNLFQISDIALKTPIGNVLPNLFSYKSKLRDQIIETPLLMNFINQFNRNHSIIRLNHIGFCYKVTSCQQEKERLSSLITKTRFHLCQEESNDAGLWFFVGNTSEWEKPMLEFIPVEKTSDKWADYWLPNIQIDIDTKLSSNQINFHIQSIFGDKIRPFPIIINGITYIIRMRLGVLDRININLDIATNLRQVKSLRQEVFKLIA